MMRLPCLAVLLKIVVENDMLADYFGLSPKFESVVAPRPSISYTLATFDWFVGLS